MLGAFFSSPHPPRHFKMAENEQKLAMATQLIEQAKEALQNPCEQRKSRMINTAVMLAMRTSTEVIEKVDKLDERVEALETALEDKMSKGDAEETLQRAAAAAQKAQVGQSPGHRRHPRAPRRSPTQPGLAACLCTHCPSLSFSVIGSTQTCGAIIL